MIFINPIEILELGSYDVSAIDSSLIKKAKRRLFVDIDLSEDGVYLYKGKKVSKSDCEKAIEDLNSPDLTDYYYFIANNHLLNNYLVTGDTKLFSSFRQESIYKIQDFINFISPYFSKQFDRTLLITFKENNVELLLRVLKYQEFITQPNINVAYRSLSIEIQNRINEVDRLKKTIKNEEKPYTENTIFEIVSSIKKLFPIEALNALPAYFQSQINKIAASINYLQLVVDENFQEKRTSLHLLEHLLKLNIESASKPIYENNYKIVKEKAERRSDEIKNAPILKNWAGKLSSVRKIAADAKEGLIPSVEIDSRIKSLIFVNELNDLPAFANEIREQIAFSLQNLSIIVWNNLDNIDLANDIIDRALNIHISERVKTDLLETKQDLGRLRFDIEQRKKKTSPVRKTSEYSNNNYGCFIFLLIAVVFFVIFAVSNSNNSSRDSNYSSSSSSLNNNEASSSYNSSSTSDKYAVDSTVMAVSDSATAVIDSALNAINDDQYENIEMNNGNISGCNNFSPEFNRTISNRLEISVGLMIDVAVKLINYSTNTCIRYVYIQKGTSYTIRNIPEGKYYLKIAYGNDWRVKKGESKCDGKFFSNSLFKKSDEIIDFNLVETANGYEVPSYSLSLDVSSTTEGNGFNTDHISENEFYEN